MASETDVDAGPEPTIVTPPGQAPEAKHGRKGGKATPATLRAPARLATLTLVEIEPSPTNPRTIFADAYIDELAASISAHGLAQMPLVRPIVSKRKGITHQLVVGECRWRAAARAGLTSIQVLVEDLTDDQAYELQLEENGKRRDLHPLEESDAYHNALLRPGWTAERIAATSKLEVSHVKARLRLQALTPATRELFLAGKFGVEIANLLARQSLPAKLQEQAAKEISEGFKERVHYDDTNEWLDFVRPLTVAEARTHLRQRYMLRLELAPFPIDDAELVAAAGSCTACPKRTGNDLELFADIAKPDICTDPVCYREKTDAWTERKIKEAKAAKVTVLPAAEAKKVFAGHFDSSTGLTSTVWGAKVAALDEKLPYEITKDYSSKKTWGDLAKEVDRPPVVIAKDPNSGAARELVDKTKLLDLARKEGALKPEKKKSSSSKSAKLSGPSPTQVAREKQERIDEAARRALFTAFGTVEPSAKAGMATSRWLMRCLIATTDLAALERVAERRGIKAKSADGLVKAMSSAAEKLGGEPLRLLLQEIIVTTIDVVGTDEEAERFIGEGCKLLGIDRKKLLEAATKTVEAELAIADKKKAAKKKS
jgi:ParB/RepB/Spo0J family partition protein